MADQFSPIPQKGVKTHNSAAPTNDNVGVLPAVSNASAPTLSEGDQVLLSVDNAGNLRVKPSGITQVSATTSANSATNPIYVEQANTTNPNSVTSPDFVELSDGTNPIGTYTNPLVVTSDSEPPTAVKDSGQLTSASVAAGAQVTIAAPVLTANKAGTLMKITASSSVRTKVQVQTVTSGASPTTTTVRTFFVEAYQSVQVEPIFGAISVAAAASQMGKFQLLITNEDNLLAADVYGSITWGEN